MFNLQSDHTLEFKRNAYFYDVSLKKTTGFIWLRLFLRRIFKENNNFWVFSEQNLKKNQSCAYFNVGSHLQIRQLI